MVQKVQRAAAKERPSIVCDVRLSCGTAGDGSEGLWYGRLAIRWPEDCGYETEGDRILVQADSIIECEAMKVSFRGEVQTEPQRTPQGDVPTSIRSPFRRKWLHVYGFFWDCWEHGFGTNAVAMKARYDTPNEPSYKREISVFPLIYADGYWSLCL